MLRTRWATRAVRRLPNDAAIAALAFAAITPTTAHFVTNYSAPLALAFTSEPRMEESLRRPTIRKRLKENVLDRTAVPIVGNRFDMKKPAPGWGAKTAKEPVA